MPPYGALLAAVLGFILVQPALAASEAGTRLAILLAAAIFAAGFRIAREERMAARLGLWATGLWVAVVLAVDWSGVATAAPRLAALFAAGALGALVVWCTVATLLRRAEADREGLFGAIFGYVLLALVFAQIYTALEVWQPGAFRLPEGADPRGLTLYFSLVTLTTLGYGDVTPVLPLARLVAGLQAVVGTLYVAVLIGRIVGTLRR